MINLLIFFTECPPCYSLVQERVNIHRGKLRELNNLILNIGNDPDAFNDTKFTEQMGSVNDSINILLNEARGASSKYILSIATDKRRYPWDILSFLDKNICCGCTSEAPHPGASNE